jgi:hypothetical protein
MMLSPPQRRTLETNTRDCFFFRAWVFPVRGSQDGGVRVCVRVQGQAQGQGCESSVRVTLRVGVAVKRTHLHAHHAARSGREEPFTGGFGARHREQVQVCYVAHVGDAKVQAWACRQAVHQARDDVDGRCVLGAQHLRRMRTNVSGRICMGTQTYAMNWCLGPLELVHLS